MAAPAVFGSVAGRESKGASPIPRYQATVSSAWPVPETFGYLAIFSNATHWDPSVAAAKQLDPGPVRVGTRFRLQVRFLGRSIPLTYAVTSNDPPRAVVLPQPTHCSGLSTRSP